MSIGVNVCLVTCWACKMGECPEEPHVWWDMDDYDFTPNRCKELPEGKCNCYCMKDYKGEDDESVQQQGALSV